MSFLQRKNLRRVHGINYKRARLGTRPRYFQLPSISNSIRMLAFTVGIMSILCSR